jgi:hypothetical protein
MPNFALRIDVKKTAAFSSLLFYPQARGQKLRDFGNFDLCVVLAVAVHFMYPLLGLVADGGDLIGLDVFGNHLCGYFYFVDVRGAHTDGIAVNYQQGVKADGLTAFTVEQLNVNSLTFRNEVLLAAGRDYCFFHMHALLEI